MTDPHRPTPTPKISPDGGEDHDPASPGDPTAARAEEASGLESASGRGGADPDALDQSIGREDAGPGDARTRDGAI